MKRWPRLALLAVAVTIVAGIAVRERYAPRLTLHVKDLLTASADPLVARLDEDLAVKLYETTQPHVGKIAALQKGLVLVHRGQALTEEGYGFGLPIVEHQGVAHISRHAETSLIRRGGRVTLVKAYRIDVADRPTRPFRMKYANVDPLGTVVFSYTVRPPDVIDVTVDFSGLDVDWQRAYLMNEQGARAFTRYVDPDGREVSAAQMGIWEAATAPFGCWEAPAAGIRFCVDATPGQPGFVGRERYRQYNWLGFYNLSWSGIDIAVDAPLDAYSYTIRIEDGIDR